MLYNTIIANSPAPSNDLSRRKEEFKEKNSLLEQAYPRISTYELYNDMFAGNLDRPFTVILSNEFPERKKQGTIRTYSSFDDLVDNGMSRNDIYLAPCSFTGNYISLATLEYVYAFIIDLDKVSPQDVATLLRFKIRRLKHPPNYIVNSGGGMHLIYVLKKPVYCRTTEGFPDKTIQSSLKRVLDALKAQFLEGGEDSYHVDQGTSLVQSYRVLGSLTKLDLLTRGYKINETHIDIKDIAKWVGEEWQKPKLIKKKEDTAMSQQGGKEEVAFMPNGKAGFYNHCAARLLNETPVGTRYMALFGLSIVAYKCNIDKTLLVEDLEHLINLFNKRDIFQRNNPLTMSEVSKAMKGYRYKFMSVSSYKLEEYFGFSFNRPKRNHRKRAEHLKIARNIKKAKTVLANEEEIKAMLEEGLAKTEIAERVGMTRQNLYKTYSYLWKTA